MKSLFKEPLPGVCVCLSENDLTKAFAVITGPFDTPYEGGFFLFEIKFPNDYPSTPPGVVLLTTGGGKVRFNPNLYANGKVCLSILGTWHGPGWTPVHTVSSVLLSIQSLMNSNPYHNEPGFETDKAFDREAVKQYNEQVRHETMRAAVIDMVDPSSSMAKSVPQQLRPLIDSVFLSFYEHYKAVAQQYQVQYASSSISHRSPCCL
jgi:ubiquitin-conjugating enzyme E2 Z